MIFVVYSRASSRQSTGSALLQSLFVPWQGSHLAVSVPKSDCFLDRLLYHGNLELKFLHPNFKRAGPQLSTYKLHHRLKDDL